MNAVDYLKIKGKMTEDCTISCNKCPIEEINNGKDIICMKFESEYPEQAVEIVEKWAKENPVKTYLSVLLEKLPNAILECDGTPAFCPSQVFKTKLKPSICNDISCIDCWNQEYKEEIC